MESHQNLPTGESTLRPLHNWNLSLQTRPLHMEGDNSPVYSPGELRSGLCVTPLQAERHRVAEQDLTQAANTLESAPWKEALWLVRRV